MELSGHNAKMEPKRESTIKLRFGAGSRGPNNAEVFKFFGKQEWTNEELSAMYRDDFSIFVKFKSEQLMREALTKLGPQTKFEYDDGTSMLVPVTAAAGAFKYVRIFGLPPEVDDRSIANAMAKYGTVQQLVRERFPVETGFPIHNGIRGVHIELVSEIPAQLTIQHVKARIYYDGLQNKCFGCGALDHLKAVCPNRKGVNSRLNAAQKQGIGSFANVVAKGVNGKTEEPPSLPGMVVLNKLVAPSGPHGSPAGQMPGDKPAASETPVELVKAPEPSKPTKEPSENVDKNHVVDVEKQSQDQQVDEEMEEEQSENDGDPMEKEGEWIEKKGKGKGKRGRPKQRPESDSSEADTNGRKQFIVPGQSHDLLDAQGSRLRSRSRSAAKPAGDKLQSNK